MAVTQISKPLIGAILLLLLLPFSTSGAPRGAAQPTFRDRSDDGVRIGVFGLFHPRELIVSATSGDALILHIAGENIPLEKSSGFASARVQISGSELVAFLDDRIFRATTLTVTRREGGPADFTLAVPNKITRRYNGELEIRCSSSSLIAIVTMESETAVASIVAAESTSETPLEALKAQAVATRSYLVSGRGRHLEFDFCDTTHCQFLREPPSPGTPVAEAVAATRNLVLVYDSRPFAAMYTHSCSGRTRTPAQAGLSSSTYPYYEVECSFCRTHPVRWTMRISPEDASKLRSSNESSRLELVRRLGWNTVPSNYFVSRPSGDHVLLQGVGRGHGIGICQSGSKAMAEAGSTFREILSHYYPNTTIVDWPHTQDAGRSYPSPAIPGN